MRAQKTELAVRVLDLALVLGRGDIADDLVARLVDPEPPVTDGNEPLAPSRLATICAHARHAVAARCSARLRALVARGFFTGTTHGVAALLDGAEAYGRGDLARAARAWRPLLRTPGSQVEVMANAMATAFDRTGESDLAERIDAEALARGGLYNGVSLAHVRAARRAAQRNDRARARELAQKVIEAWSLADEEVPAVAEMRRLLAQMR